MKTWLTLLVTILLGGGLVGACNALFIKQTPGQEARDRCVKGYIAKNQLTPNAVAICEGIKLAVDSGKLKP